MANSRRCCGCLRLFDRVIAQLNADSLANATIQPELAVEPHDDPQFLVEGQPAVCSGCIKREENHK